MKKELLSLGLLIITGVGLYLFSRGVAVDEMYKETLYFGGKEIVVEIADDVVSRTRGLSGRESLSDGEGLLFVFDEPGQYGFWMKEMNFPIDILWFNAEKELVDITNNLSPDTFPETFYPKEPVLYVLEVNESEFSGVEEFLGDKFELSTVKSD